MDKRFSRLLATEILDSGCGIHLAFHQTIKSLTARHSHDFHEVFLTQAGQVYHEINGIRQLLVRHSLLFIRPTDVHHYIPFDGEPFKLINLAFEQHFFDDMAHFFDEGVYFEELMVTKAPPQIIISASQAEHIILHMEQLAWIDRAKPAEIRLRTKALLVEIFMHFLENGAVEVQSDMPAVLGLLIKKMEIPDNFKAGAKRMRQISGYSAEHLCRLFRKYLDTTPSAYINDLRLDHAIRLLIDTDAAISSIAFDCGYNNLSHFNHLFKDRNRVSPGIFRKQHQRKTIP